MTFFKNFQSSSLSTGKSFQSNATKFSHPGLHIALSQYPKAGPKKGTINISPNKILKSFFFILRCCITKDRRSCYSCNYIRFNHNPCYTAYNTETFKRKSTFCKFKYTILSKGYKESHFYKLTVIVANEPYTDQLYLQKSTWFLFTSVYFDTTVF